MRNPLRGWLVVALLLIFMAIDFAEKIVLELSARPIMRGLQLTRVLFGVISSTFFLLFSLSAAIFRIVESRLPTRWMLAGMMVCRRSPALSTKDSDGAADLDAALPSPAQLASDG